MQGRLQIKDVTLSGDYSLEIVSGKQGRIERIPDPKVEYRETLTIRLSVEGFVCLRVAVHSHSKMSMSAAGISSTCALTDPTQVYHADSSQGNSCIFFSIWYAKGIIAARFGIRIQSVLLVLRSAVLNSLGRPRTRPTSTLISLVLQCSILMLHQSAGV